jgi:hypothetical protein
VKEVVEGRNVALPIDPTQPILIRQSTRVGNDCATTVLACTPNKLGTRLRCKTTTPPEP